MVKQKTYILYTCTYMHTYVHRQRRLKCVCKQTRVYIYGTYKRIIVKQSPELVLMQQLV